MLRLDGWLGRDGHQVVQRRALVATWRERARAADNQQSASEVLDERLQGVLLVEAQTGGGRVDEHRPIEAGQRAGAGRQCRGRLALDLQAFVLEQLDQPVGQAGLILEDEHAPGWLDDDHCRQRARLLTYLQLRAHGQDARCADGLGKGQPRLTCLEVDRSVGNRALVEPQAQARIHRGSREQVDRDVDAVALTRQGRRIDAMHDSEWSQGGRWHRHVRNRDSSGKRISRRRCSSVPTVGEQHHLGRGGRIARQKRAGQLECRGQISARAGWRLGRSGELRPLSELDRVRMAARREGVHSPVDPVTRPGLLVGADAVGNVDRENHGARVPGGAESRLGQRDHQQADNCQSNGDDADAQPAARRSQTDPRREQHRGHCHG